MTKFQNIPEAISYLGSASTVMTPAKKRRLMKEFETLGETNFESITLKSFDFSSASISITVSLR